MKKFAGKYRIPSARAPWWDYANDGAYFVTICTAHRECCFGDVADGKMHFSTLGQIANNIWEEIPRQFPYAELGEYQVMPNHVHGIIVINGNSGRDAINRVSTPRNAETNAPIAKTTASIAETDASIAETDASIAETTASIAETDASIAETNAPIAKTTASIAETDASIAETDAYNADETPGGITGNNNPMLNDNLSRILRWYKGRVTFECHQTDAKFGWQERFYDIIIRDTASYHRISEYIINNPAKWDTDKFNPSK